MSEKKQKSNTEISDSFIFDIEDCKHAAQASIEETKKEYGPKLKEVYVGVIIFPVAGLLFILLASFVGPRDLKENLILGAIMVLGLGFFSYIVWSGSSNVRAQLKKRTNSANNALEDLRTIETFFCEKRPYVLYLRDFAAGAGTHTVREVKAPSFVGGYVKVADEGSMRLEIVSEYLNRFMPIVMLHNSKDRTHDYKGHILYCSNEKWFKNFKTVAEHASIVVLDYSNNFLESPAIIDEIEFLIHKKTPLIAVGTAVDISNLSSLGLKLTRETTISVLETYDRHEGFIVQRESTQKIVIPSSLDVKLKAISRKSVEHGG